MGPITESHPNAERAAEAAEAAADRGRFWEMHDALFERREEWIHALDATPIARVAADLRLDPAEVRAAIDGRAYDQRIRDDFVSGLHSGVNGTPTFFVNGTRYDGRWDGDQLLHLLRDTREVVATR